MFAMNTDNQNKIARLQQLNAQLDYYHAITGMLKSADGSNNNQPSFWGGVTNYVLDTRLSDTPEHNWRRAAIFGAPGAVLGAGIGALTGNKKNRWRNAFIGLGLGGLLAGAAGYYGHSWMPQAVASSVKNQVNQMPVVSNVVSRIPIVSNIVSKTVSDPKLYQNMSFRDLKTMAGFAGKK